jgi:hypothetical protein
MMSQVASVLAVPLVAIANKIDVKVDIATLHSGANKTLWDEHGSKGLG